MILRLKAPNLPRHNAGFVRINDRYVECFIIALITYTLSLAFTQGSDDHFAYVNYFEKDLATTRLEPGFVALISVAKLIGIKASVFVSLVSATSSALLHASLNHRNTMAVSSILISLTVLLTVAAYEIFVSIRFGLASSIALYGVSSYFLDRRRLLGLSCALIGASIHYALVPLLFALLLYKIASFGIVLLALTSPFWNGLMVSVVKLTGSSSYYQQYLNLEVALENKVPYTYIFGYIAFIIVFFQRKKISHAGLYRISIIGLPMPFIQMMTGNILWAKLFIPFFWVTLILLLRVRSNALRDDFITSVLFSALLPGSLLYFLLKVNYLL